MTESTKTPFSITWSGYLALILLVLIPASVFMVRGGEWQSGLGLYAVACLGSVILLMLFITFMLLPRFQAHRAAIRKRALLTLPGTAALLALTLGGGDYPQIHDITTNTEDPPLFVTAPTQRGEGANPLAIKPDFIQQQVAAYPDLKTLRSDLSRDAAFERAAQVAADLGWEIYHRDAGAGVIEAVDTTRIMAFKDDIVIRVRGDANSSRLDLRSVSRVGRGDIGANTKRIRAFVDAFNAG